MRVYIIAVHSLLFVESLSSACVNNLEFAEIRFILFALLCDCNNAAPMPNFEIQSDQIAKENSIFRNC